MKLHVLLIYDAVCIKVLYAGGPPKIWDHKVDKVGHYIYLKVELRIHSQLF